MRYGLTAILVLVIGSMASQVAHSAPVAPDWQWLFDEADLNSTTVLETGAAAAGAHGTVGGNVSGDLRSSTQTPFSYPENRSFVAGSVRNVRAPVNAAVGMTTSISLWVRFDTSFASSTSYAFDSEGGSGRLLWYYTANGTQQNDGIYWNATNMHAGNIVGVLNNGIWRHMVLVRNGNALDVWEGDLGDEIAKKGTLPAGSAATTLGTLVMGSRFSDGDFFRGELDEVAIWDSELSADDIAWLHTNSLNSIPEPAGLAVMGLAAVGLMARRRRGVAG